MYQDEQGSTVRRNIARGVRWGLVFAGAATVLATPFALVRLFVEPAVEWQRQLSFFRIVALYLLGGISGGVVVGLLWDLRRWWWGRRLIGMVAAIPFVYATGITIVGWEDWTKTDTGVWLFSALVWGFVMSFVPEGQDR